MWSARNRADDTGGHRLAAVEDLRMDPLRCRANRLQHLFHVRHETIRPAEIDVCICRKANPGQDRSRQMSCHIEILTQPLLRVGPAMADIAAGIRKCEHQAADFRGEWMMLPI